MPRKKIQPEDRQRSTIACTPCKKAKIRCNASSPCATCVKRGLESSCIYPEPAIRNHRRRRSQLGSSADGAPRHKPLATFLDTDLDPINDSTADHVSILDGSKVTEPESRILFTSKFQKGESPARGLFSIRTDADSVIVYIGETASLSYLQFLRRIVEHRMGASTPFSQGEFNNFMLENDVVGDGHDVLIDLDPENKTELAQCYLDATSGILDLVAKADILQSLDDALSATGVATAYLALAIGAQCRGSAPSDMYHAAAFFSRGQRLSFQGMLCDPSVEMVRNFTLMAFYMLGACHRNAAFMYLGVASKAASALGLDRADQYRRLPTDECCDRLNTWKSLRVLDTIVNSILGRSGGLTTVTHDPRLDELCRGGASSDYSRGAALQSVFDICPFMDDLDRNECNKDVASTQDFLQRLQRWSKTLPADLRTPSDVDEKPTLSIDREHFLGRSSVACVYYFTVVLKTRRFLTLYLLHQLEERTSSADKIRSRIDDKTSSMADVCLCAAVSLAKVGHNAMMSGQMMSNMCLLKAWMFAAGLLLGFSIFAQGSAADEETREAFNHACAVLEELSKLSPQAGHYHQILASFADASSLYQSNLVEERKSATGRYLEQVFTSTQRDSKSSGRQSSTTYPINDIAMNEPGDPISLEQSGSGNLLGSNMSAGPHGMTVSEGFPWPADDLSLDWQTGALLCEDAVG